MPNRNSVNKRPYNRQESVTALKEKFPLIPATPKVDIKPVKEAPQPPPAVKQSETYPSAEQLSISRQMLEDARIDGLATGFREGVRYIIRMAEGFLAQSEGFSSNRDLTHHVDKIPTWWIKTLIKSYGYKSPAEDYFKSIEIDAEPGPSLEALKKG